MNERTKFIGAWVSKEEKDEKNRKAREILDNSEKEIEEESKNILSNEELETYRKSIK